MKTIYLISCKCYKFVLNCAVWFCAPNQKSSLSVCVNHLQTLRKPCGSAPLAESAWKRFSTLTRTSMNMDVKAA